MTTLFRAAIWGIIIGGMGVSSLEAGEGKYEGTDLTLHMFFATKRPKEQLIGTSDSSFAGTWKDYLRQAADKYFDAHEGQSRIKRIYLYNALPEGLSKADINVCAVGGPQATVRGFGNPGQYVYLPEEFYTKALGSAHSMQSLGHELGHYIYGLLDSYGGQIKTAAGAKLPLEVLTSAA